LELTARSEELEAGKLKIEVGKPHHKRLTILIENCPDEDRKADRLARIREIA
jgi:hypothetical protein